ncbi:hypothetical protein [Streptomyces albipurpureus]|uniref:Uncharacterized protein n=1 Tax=Streptomyces albipurpureus TaxID=2897419 RepID=A0ABT0UW51_9ACTN|nr:hypothetical protein [Streptomyces sp. CWNU-1]MCM2391870.1 hypothetical protein [Streptomyces sp. CWNU-1]
MTPKRNDHSGPSRPVADPTPLGHRVVQVIARTVAGRVFAMDSLLYVKDPSIGHDDVVIAASYCGAGTVAHALSKGVKGVIAHDAGVGKEAAGIAGLPLADRYGVPAAAVAGETGGVSNGLSLAAGEIGSVNAAAAALGVRPGQPALRAAQLMLAAERGQAREIDIDLDNTIHEIVGTRGHRILVVRTLTSLPKDQDFSSDVVVTGVHSGGTKAALLKTWPVRGWIANDAGMAKNRSGIAGLRDSDEIGVAAASVSCFSARIDDAMSTYHEGFVSAANETARAMGVTIGMSAASAAGFMAGLRDLSAGQ